jgi:hypothetical protein
MSGAILNHPELLTQQHKSAVPLNAQYISVVGETDANIETFD